MTPRPTMTLEGRTTTVTRDARLVVEPCGLILPRSPCRDHHQPLFLLPPCGIFSFESDLSEFKERWRRMINIFRSAIFGVCSGGVFLLPQICPNSCLFSSAGVYVCRDESKCMLTHKYTTPPNAEPLLKHKHHTKKYLFQSRFVKPSPLVSRLWDWAPPILINVTFSRLSP